MRQSNGRTTSQSWIYPPGWFWRRQVWKDRLKTGAENSFMVLFHRNCLWDFSWRFCHQKWVFQVKDLCLLLKGCCLLAAQHRCPEQSTRAVPQCNSRGVSQVTWVKAVKSGSLGFGSKFCWLHSNRWMQTQFHRSGQQLLAGQRKAFPTHRSLSSSPEKAPSLVAGLQSSSSTQTWECSWRPVLGTEWPTG